MSKTRVSLLSSNRDNAPRGTDLDWSELAALLGAGGVAASPCTLETCGAGDNRMMYPRKTDGAIVMVPKDGHCRHKYTSAWTPAVYPPGATRANRNVGVVSLLVVDLDHLTDDQLDAAARPLQSYRYIAHPSHSDRPGDRCWRVVLALSEPVLAADWPRFWIAVMAELGQPADPACCDAARLYFLPTRRADAPDGEVDVHDGQPIDVRGILAKAPPAAPERALSDAGDLPPAGPALLQRCRQRLVDHGPAVEGQGGDRWTFSACAALIHGYALTEAEAWPLLLEWNATCEPPWDESDLHTKLANAHAYAAGPRGGARLEWEAGEGLRNRLTATADARRAEAAQRAAGTETMYEPVDLGGDDDEPSDSEAGSDQLPFDHDAALSAIAAAQRGETVEPEDEPGFAGAVRRARREVGAALGRAESAGEAPVEAAPLFVSAAELLAAPVPQTPWLVRFLLRHGGVAMIGAGPKSTKTWKALTLAIAIATGTRAFGSDRFKVPQPRAVAYFFAEDDHSSISSKVRALAAGMRLNVDDVARNLYLRPAGEHLDLLRDDHVAWIIASCREIPSLGMLVLDPLRDVHSGAENEADAMAKVMARLRFISAALGGITVLVPHHAKKLTREDIAGGALMAGGALRGSSAVFGALDSLLMVALDEKTSDEGTFSTDVRAIIKGARAAGSFSLTLKVIDDDRDQAKFAEWTYQDRSAKRAEEATETVGVSMAADLAVQLIEFMRLIEARKEPLKTWEQLRKGAQLGGAAKMTAAIAHAEGKSWIHRPKQKWELTELGRRVDLDGGARE